MDIKETFLKLTDRTYPHGTEHQLFHLLPQDLDMDQFGNLYKQIGDNPTTMFACHLDTATSANTEVMHFIDGDIIKTDGTSILGADDKAGVTILMYMMENKIPGLYYFFMGEEVGCVGSKKLAEFHKKEKIESIQKVISFDRRGTSSIITHQCSARCCSDEFSASLADQLNRLGLEVYDNDITLSYIGDSTGLYTDSAQFIRIYPECTNISVGYKSEHTFSEEQNIKHLDKLAKTCILVDWDSLVIKRDPSKYEYSNYGYDGYSYGGWSDYEDGYDSEGYGRGYKVGGYNKLISSPVPIVKADQIYWLSDEEKSHLFSVKMDGNNKLLDISLSKERISDENSLIVDLLHTMEVDYTSFTWDGYKMIVYYSDGRDAESDRNELSDFLPELDFWKDIFEKKSNKKVEWDY